MHEIITRTLFVIGKLIHLFHCFFSVLSDGVFAIIATLIILDIW